MCRHLAYLGAPISASTLLHDAAHGLAQQAREPRFVDIPSPDGAGIGWYEEGKPRTVRSTAPLWEQRLAEDPIAELFIASARAATPGGPVELCSTAPFSSDRYLFSLNGFVAGYRAGVAERLRGMVSARRRTGIEGDVDSTVVFALVLDQLDMDVSLREALANAHAMVRGFSDAPLNMLLTDGVGIAATASGHSLFMRSAQGSTILASEPLDDRAWERIPDDHLIDISRDGCEAVALGSVFVELSSPCSMPARSLLGTE